jgi:GTP-binding protein HflX
VREADLLVHVLDISHPAFEDQYLVVNQTLAELNHADKPVILVFNKIDAYHSESEETGMEELKKTWMSKKNNTSCVYISATNKKNI